jgi:hypothetical protein
VSLFEETIPQNTNTMEDFKQWMEENVVARMDKFGNKFFSTQDALYHNAIYGMDELIEYYKKEFLINQ